MHAASNFAVATALGSVVVVLLLGLFNTLRGGSANLSQQFMRWRIGLQFLAIILIMGVLWLRG